MYGNIAVSGIWVIVLILSIAEVPTASLFSRVSLNEIVQSPGRADEDVAAFG